MRLAGAVLFYTDRELEEYRAASGVGDTRPLAALNNGLNVEAIRSVRTPYNPNDRLQTLLFIGRLTRKAKLELLLEALALHEAQGVSLHVIGWGEEGSRLKARALALGIGHRVHWHGALNDEKVIAEIANLCGVFVYPGEVGLSLIHGMAYGLPAIVHSNRWGHMPEIAAFEDGVTGRAFERDDPRSLAAVISEMQRSLEVLKQQSAASLARADNDFNTEEMARRFASLVELII